MSKSILVNAFKALILTVVLVTANQAEAALVAPFFENAVQTYSVLKANYESARAVNQSQFEAEIAPFKTEIESLKQEIASCVTFDCAKQKQDRIDVLKYLVLTSTQKHTDSGQDLLKNLVSSGDDLALEALASELRTTTLLDRSLSNVNFADDSNCSSRSKNLDYMRCRQIKVEFKTNGHFYKVVTAIGLPFGNDPCVLGPAQWDLGKLDRIFASTRDQFMLGVTAQWFFLEDATASMGREKGSGFGNWCSGQDYFIWGGDDPSKGIIGFYVQNRQSI